MGDRSEPVMKFKIDPALKRGRSKTVRYRVYSLIFLMPVWPSFRKLFNRFAIPLPQQLENNRSRDIRHDAEAEDRDDPQIGRAEHGDFRQQLAEGGSVFQLQLSAIFT